MIIIIRILITNLLFSVIKKIVRNWFASLVRVICKSKIKANDDQWLWSCYTSPNRFKHHAWLTRDHVPAAITNFSLSLYLILLPVLKHKMIRQKSWELWHLHVKELTRPQAKLQKFIIVLNLHPSFFHPIFEEEWSVRGRTIFHARSTIPSETWHSDETYSGAFDIDRKKIYVIANKRNMLLDW